MADQVLESKAVRSERRKAVLAALKAKGRAAPPARPSDRERRESESRELPLSFAQQRLWFIEQMQPGSPLYNVPTAYRARGPLSLAALAASLGEILRRHEVLRARFFSVDGRPVQSIDPWGPVTVAVVDLARLAPEVREAELERLVDAEARRPFDLARGGLLRTQVLRCGGDDHVLCFGFHHIVSDGWSVEIFLRELAELYRAGVANRPSPLPVLAVQYADFADWQRQWLQGEVLAAAVSHWRQRLAGAQQLLELPADRPRPAVPSYRGRVRHLALSAALSDSLGELGRRGRTTLFATALATFKALLHRLTGQEDLVVGCPVANRNWPGAGDLIGLFLNTLPLRTRLAGGMSFLECLAGVRETCLDAFSHQDLPFERLVEELQPERSLAYAPLFQTSLSVQRASAVSTAGPLAMTPFPVTRCTAKLDLALALLAGDGGPTVAAEYSTDLFEGTTIARLLGHFRALLAAAARSPETALAALPLLDEAERQQLGNEWNDTLTTLPPVDLARLFQAQAERWPEKVALVSGSVSLTYRELDARSNALAQQLRALGVGPEEIVAIALERSADMVLALLGILKAGGAYVPVDPAYPRERRAYVLTDCGARIVLTRSRLLDDLPELAARLLCLDAAGTASGASPLAVEVLPENLAYVLYTSGSTGRPKGVQISRRALLNFLAAMAERPGLGPHDVLLAVSSLSFDIAALELLLPLLVGARVELASAEEVAEGDRLLARLSASGATVMQATPATWRMLLAAGWQGGELAVLCGGEALAEDLAGELRGRGGPVWNLYGPTETTVWSMVEEVRGEGPVLVGRPIANTRVDVVDRQLRLVPVGVPGELSIGGTGLARGYRGRADLTAERFVPDPISGERGARLYRTGDLARRRPCGRIEFLGRLDQQVKVRGFRIEPGEVETVLRGHPGIREAAVLAWGRGDADRCLVAYVVTGDPAPTAQGCREFLLGKLPEYMVPTLFVPLAGLPLTPNGKVDRRALPPPVSPGPPAVDRPPRNPVEEVLADIWGAVLDLGRVGVDDDFFARGGHSLLATQLVARVRQTFGIDLPLRSLFEAPTPAGLAGQVETMLRLATAPPLPSIVPVPRNAALPLSFSQERQWILDRLEPGTAAYNISLVLSLAGLLRPACLARSLAEIRRRHESLRSTFVEQGGVPVQRIAPPEPVPLPVVDLRALPRTPRQAEERRLERDSRQRSFDLARGPLLRAGLLRWADREHTLLLTYHHIVADGWSAGILLRELATLYQAFAGGLPSPLSELPIQYADYACWQREWLAGEVLGGHLGYWRERLAGVPPLALPLDRPRPQVQTYRGARQAFSLDRELSAALQQRARADRATLFMTLLAAVGALLARSTGQRDFAVGTFVANRGRPEVEGLIGFFVNNLALRVDLSGDPTFRQLLAGVRQRTLEAYAHEETPFEKVVEELRLPRDLGRTPLFQVMLVHQNWRAASFTIPDLGVRSRAVGGERANFDLTVWTEDTPEGLRLSLEYNRDLFDAATIRRWAGHLERLIRGALDRPETALSELPLLADAQRHQLCEWNDTLVEVEDRLCLHQLSELQARRTPDAVAVVGERGALTYRELNARANRLAHRLIRFGLGPEARVALCLERTPELIVGALGILKAGGAYVPIDPSSPRERIEFVLADSGAALLLTAGQPAASLHDGALPVLRLDADDADRAAAMAADEDDPAVAVDPENLAYLIYTSGSTGRPKAVMCRHKSVVSYTLAAARAFGLGRDDRVLQFLSLSFDASAEEIYPCLTRGATLVLRDEAMLGSATQFLDTCRRWRLTVLDLPTAFWHELVAQSGESLASLARSVRLVIIAGEQALPERLAAWHRAVGDRVRLVNTYGPTEATIVATSCDLSLATAREHENPPVPIGRPVANLQVHLLDRDLQLLPIGVTGELYLAGIGLARGYLARPDLTAAAFVPNPHAYLGEGGARLYKTGDLGHYLPDGRIEFLGRADRQVKVRGFRVELGEIESRLRDHPAVRDAVVVAQREPDGGTRLVAYLAGAVELLPSTRELRDFLHAKLPAYMAPSAVVPLAAFPLNTSGKIDRQALPLPAAPSMEQEDQPAPRTPMEELVAGVWCEVLRLDQIGVHDDFFALGGHSLRATQVASRLRQALGHEVPLRTLFEAPTVTALAAWLDRAARGGPAAEEPPLARVPRDAELPLSFSQQRLWLLDQLDPGSPAYNLPSRLPLHGRLDVAALAWSFREIVRRHEVLRTSFAAVDGQPRQIVATEADLTIGVVDLTLCPGQEREARRLAREEARRPFDLARDRLLRVTVLRLADQEHLLLLTLHHIVSDGWSSGILVRELAELYRTHREGRPSRLPELAVQYADFSCWQRQRLQGELLASQLAYWRQRLAGAPTLLEVPADRPRPAQQSFRGAVVSFALSRELTSRVGGMARRHEATPFMVLLAAFQSLLSRSSGQEDLLVGTPIANRDRPELEALIGFFVNLLPLRADLSGAPSLRELLARTRESALGAYHHQALPFERLVEELQPERDLSYSPLFQFLFVFQNVPLEPLRLPGLTVSPVAAASSVARFDWTLTLFEHAARLEGWLEYNTDLFDAATAWRTTGHLEVLLDGGVEEPDRGLPDLPLLTAAELAQVVREWSSAPGSPPTDVLVHERFARWAARAPEAPAVQCEEELLSYGELARRAGRLARRLQRLDVGPEVLVGIALERSLAVIVTILAVLEAGGAYIPLDPSYPRERLAFMLEDSGVRIILTASHLLTALPAHGARVVCVDDDEPEPAQAATHAPAHAATDWHAPAAADQLAYGIYTSGSTGTPKGVLVSHRSLAALASGFVSALGLGPGDRLLMVPSLSFDASVGDLFPALASGATLVVPRSPSDLTGSALQALCDERGITVVDIPAAFWQQWLDELSASGVWKPRTLRLVIAGGESVTCDRVRLWQQMTARRVDFFGPYGPTEATVCSTFHRVAASAEPPRRAGTLPIGRPLPGARVHLLDRRLHPVPAGVPGEVFIGGTGLARGYLGHPDVAAERFLPTHFGELPGARVYRTGDLARYLPDGELEFLGRADQQVKIRGYRIELGEIESLLASHPGVRKAVVLVREDRPGQRRLAAYLACDPGCRPAASKLRSFLRERLPGYMVPAAFVLLEDLPVTAHGKVDRRALPAPDETSRVDAAGAHVTPRTAEERLLAAIWAQVLGVAEVGIHDNFFDLGGDSILSIQIAARARQANLRLAPRQLFQHQSIAELAAELSQEAGGATAAEQGLVTGPVPLTPIQSWFFTLDLEEPHHFNQAFLFELRGGQDALAPRLWHAVARGLAAHHDALRLRFRKTEEGWEQWCATPEEPVPAFQIDLSPLPAAIRLVALERAAQALQGSLDLTRGPLIRFCVFDLGDGQGRLLIVVHQLAMDAASWRVLLADLSTAHSQVRSQGPILLPPKTSSYREWAERLVRQARSEVVRRELAWWLDEPWGAAASLPRDLPGGPEADLRCASSRFCGALGAEETRLLLQAIPAADRAGVEAALLAALVQTIGRWTGRRVLRVALEGQNRRDLFADIDLARTVGWCAVSFPVLLDLRGVLGPVEVLRTIQERLETLPNRGIGYGLLRYLAGDPGVERRLRSLPLPEVAFNYRGPLDWVSTAGELLAPAREMVGSLQSARGRRPYLLEIDASVVGGRLETAWIYSSTIHRESTIGAVVQGFLDALRELIAGCQSRRDRDHSPVDFPQAGLSRTELDRLAATVMDSDEAMVDAKP
jgi:amino acid adenylation domain-containing protein/non-ribosomal peptide synthase protein (TIGR01720 family)